MPGVKRVFSILLAICLAGAVNASGGEPVTDHQRIVLITGSTDGLGREIARALAAAGDEVIVHGRNRERGEALVRELNAAGPGRARFYAADFGELAGVRDLAAAITRDYPRLDVLVNNAGIALAGDESRPLSGDGYELHFQVNYLSGFLLTDLLLPLLEKSPAPRIVNVSSGAADPLDFDNLNLETGYSGWRAYGQSKLAQVMYTISLSEKLPAGKFRVNALHPATFMDTHMVLSLGVTPQSSVEEGRDAVLHLINGEDVGSGGFYNGLAPARAHQQAYDPAVREQLWQVSEQLTGARYESIP
jgi:NAD(P)-dependent dehydrogenase (short-subunit alcohol dehydrogenase family)